MDISISYMGQMLPIKKPFPFQSQTIHSSATQFLMQSKLSSLQNGRCPFIFDYSTCSSNPPPPYPLSPCNLHQQFLSYLSQFSPPYFTSLLVHKNITSIPTNTPFLNTSAI